MKIALLKATIEEHQGGFNKKTLESLISKTKDFIQHFIDSKEKADIIMLPEYSLGCIKVDTYKKGDRDSIKKILSNDSYIKHLIKYSEGKSSLIILNKTIVYDKNGDNATFFIKDGKIDHVYLKYSVTISDTQLITGFSDPRGDMISKLENDWLENKKNNKPYWWAERGLTVGTRICLDQDSEREISEDAEVEKLDIKIVTSLGYFGNPETLPQPWIREKGLLINNDGWYKKDDLFPRLYVCQKNNGKLSELRPKKDSQWFKTYKVSL